jgi:hypothetical protein
MTRGFEKQQSVWLFLAAAAVNISLCNRFSGKQRWQSVCVTAA